MKTCSKCGRDKDLSEFRRQVGGRDGLDARCKVCSNSSRRRYYCQSTKIQEANQRYYVKNKAKLRRDQAAYYQNNKAARKKKQKEWRLTPSGIASAHARSALRQARLYNAPGYASAEQIQARIDYYGRKCYLKLGGCAGDYEHLEHVIPLSRGGSNWPSNLRPACEHCNLKKLAKPLAEVRALAWT